jgi:hypothetical protein
MRGAVAILLTGVAVWLGACSPDLQELAGPAVPVPVITGRVVRTGLPVPDQKVKVEDPTSGSIIETARTGVDGVFHLFQVQPGSWTLRADSSDPRDFARVTYEFVLASTKNTWTPPDLDLARRGFETLAPAADTSLALPGFFNPVAFEWLRPEGFTNRVQVRVYRQSGEPVWFSEKSGASILRWNGLGNQPGFEGALGG